MKFDAIVIGTGQAGPALAVDLANSGLAVAVIERKDFGGTCVNTGCIPTKTLVASAYAAFLARRAQEYGVVIDGNISVDMKKVKARKDEITQGSTTGVETWLRNTKNITVIVGGMPEAVATFLENDDLQQVRAVQKEILDAYTLDFAKHAPDEEVMKIMAVWNLVPSQLAKENKKFIFSAISKSARAREYETSIQWLTDAGLIVKSHNTSTPKLPLDVYSDKRAFKIFMLDVGLLGAISKLDPKLILEENKLFQEFKGALTENYVAQELHNKHYDGLYYWTSSGTAEVDFLTTTHQKIFPLEVKAGISKAKKSLLVYGEKYSADDDHTSILSRTTLRNFAHDGNIVNYPLYAVSLFPKFSIINS